MDESPFTAAIFSVASRCFRLGCEACFHFFVFFIFRFDFVMTGGGVDSRGGGGGREFVGGSRGCGLGTFFEPFGLSSFFLVCAEEAGVEAEGVGGGLGGGVGGCLSPP